MIECAKVFVIPENYNRDLLDYRLLTFNGLVGQDRESDGSYEVRCLSSTKGGANSLAAMIKFAVEHQGYGEVVRVEEADDV